MASTKQPQYEVDREQLDRYLLQLEGQQSFGSAVVGGISWAIVGASMWSMAAIVTGGIASYMAVPLGFVVGFGVRFTGRGIQARYGILAAAMVVLGCLVGHGMAVTLFEVRAERADLWGRLADLFLQPALIGGRLAPYFRPFDLLFYGVGLYLGTWFALKPIREEELLRFVRPVRRWRV